MSHDNTISAADWAKEHRGEGLALYANGRYTPRAVRVETPDGEAIILGRRLAGEASRLKRRNPSAAVHVLGAAKTPYKADDDDGDQRSDEAKRRKARAKAKRAKAMKEAKKAREQRAKKAKAKKAKALGSFELDARLDALEREQRRRERQGRQSEAAEIARDPGVQRAMARARLELGTGKEYEAFARDFAARYVKNAAAIERGDGVLVSHAPDAFEASLERAYGRAAVRRMSADERRMHAAAIVGLTDDQIEIFKRETAKAAARRREQP